MYFIILKSGHEMYAHLLLPNHLPRNSRHSTCFPSLILVIRRIIISLSVFIYSLSFALSLSVTEEQVVDFGQLYFFGDGVEEPKGKTT
jgi:hypothetical protein